MAGWARLSQSDQETRAGRCRRDSRARARIRLASAASRQRLSGGDKRSTPPSGDKGNKRWARSTEARPQQACRRDRRSRPKGRCHKASWPWQSGRAGQRAPGGQCRRTARHAAAGPKWPPRAASGRPPCHVGWPVRQGRLRALPMTAAGRKHFRWCGDGSCSEHPRQGCGSTPRDRRRKQAAYDRIWRVSRATGRGGGPGNPTR